jgi:protein-tyrosine phosphatase
LADIEKIAATVSEPSLLLATPTFKIKIDKVELRTCLFIINEPLKEMAIMDFDYSKGCINFRDVGKSVNAIAGKQLLPEWRLLRGGQIDHVVCEAKICHPATVINLRTRPDHVSFGTRIYHFPISNDYEKYETENPEIKHWLNRILNVFVDPSLPYPVMIHCMTGKDRTGVLVAVLLRVLGISDDLIIKEYMLSEGVIKEEWIKRALAGIGDPSRYFSEVNIPIVRKNFFMVTGATLHPFASS